MLHEAQHVNHRFRCDNLPTDDLVNIHGPDLHAGSTCRDVLQFASVSGAECQRSDDAVPVSDLWVETMVHIGERCAERLEEPTQLCLSKEAGIPAKCHLKLSESSSLRPLMSPFSKNA